jgi:hypothetical protein
MGVYDMRVGSGILDRTGVTMQSLRNFATRWTPSNAIIGTRVNQSVRYAQRGFDSRYGVVETPSFKIRMRDREAVPTREDLINIRALEDFFENAGWCPPPEEDRPIGWRAGLDWAMKGFVRDTFTIDYVPLKRWSQKGDAKRYPLVAFAFDDGALYRNVVGEKKYDPNTGRLTIAPWDGDRKNLKGKVVRTVRLNGDGSYSPVNEYTAAEVVPIVRNPRLDEGAFGYGFPETEQAISSILNSIRIQDWNTTKFTNNHVPRGFFSVIGNMSNQAQRQFENKIMQMMTSNRWAIPMLLLPPGAPNQTPPSVQWNDIGQPLAEGEYQQMAFALLTETHAAYHISLEETGLAAASPFAKSLSENSPVADITNSQTHFTNLMVDISGFFNRELLWKMPYGKRYQFEWVGLEERNYLAEEELISNMLQNGTITLRMLYKYRDMPLPDTIKDSPAVDIPGPFMEVLQYLDQKEQMQVQQDMMERDQADQQAQAEAQYRQVRQKGPQASTVPQNVPSQPQAPDESPVAPESPQGGRIQVVPDQPNVGGV